MRSHSRQVFSWLQCTTLLAGVIIPTAAHGDFFGEGENRFEIPFVTIGNPGNIADTTGSPNPAGSVGYDYAIGQFEVPEEAITKAIAQSTLDGDPLNVMLTVERGGRKPATTLRYAEIALFVNWLNEQKGASPAYKIDTSGSIPEFQLWEPADPGYDPSNPFRNRGAIYVLPTTDEWYKAAYYDPVGDQYFDYATGGNELPTPVASGNDPGTAVWNQLGGPADVELAGGSSPYRTIGQTGNVLEWHETAFDLVNDVAGETRSFMGGDWRLNLSGAGLDSTARGQSDHFSRPQATGFRIVRIPEPSSLVLLGLCFSTCGPRRNDRIR